MSGHILGDRADWTEPVVRWRRAVKSGPRTPVVLLLHGRGADENDLFEIADRLPRAYDYASVRAPVPVEGGGYTWYENRGPAKPIASSLRTSLASFRAVARSPERARRTTVLRARLQRRHDDGGRTRPRCSDPLPRRRSLERRDRTRRARVESPTFTG